jgi:hypothetical protein
MEKRPTVKKQREKDKQINRGPKLNSPQLVGSFFRFSVFSFCFPTVGRFFIRWKNF